MCSLNNETVTGGDFELYINGTSIDIVIWGDSFTTDQLISCSGSCNGAGRINCTDDEGNTYTGTCSKICCTSCGVVANLTSCTKT
jgi:hypothetical protein